MKYCTTDTALLNGHPCTNKLHYLENNNTSFPVQIEWHCKLIKEVNNKYRQFTLATHKNTKEESNKARILTVERIEKSNESQNLMDWNGIMGTPHMMWTRLTIPRVNLDAASHTKLKNLVKLTKIHQN